MKAFVVETLAGAPLDDAGRITALADRADITDARSGEVLWRTSADANPDALRAAVDRFMVGVRRIEIDPANPLSFLLVDCLCNPRSVVNCPVHGPRRLGRKEYHSRRELGVQRRVEIAALMATERHHSRRERGAQRRAEVVALMATEGNQSAVARRLGISQQRVSQLLHGKRSVRPLRRQRRSSEEKA